MARSGFFNQIPAIPERQKTEYSFIPVGGEQFHAVAVALIDALKHSLRVNETALTKILKRFFAYYPKFISPQAYLTPAERMGMLINSARKSEIVECMAYVLRQIAVDEIYARPLNYREAFNGLKSDDSKELLRQPDTVLPASILRALTQALGMTFTLSVVEHGKELRKREIYTNQAINSPKLEIIVQAQGDMYFPGVKNKADFAYVGQLAITPPKPLVQPVQQQETVAQYLAEISEDNKDLAQEFKRLVTIITQNIVDNISFEDLMALYISFYPKQNGILGNTNEFFDKLMESEKQPVSVDSPGVTKQHLIARSIAGWICAQQIDADAFFDAAELKTDKQSARVKA